MILDEFEDYQLDMIVKGLDYRSRSLVVDTKEWKNTRELYSEVSETLEKRIRHRLKHGWHYWIGDGPNENVTPGPLLVRKMDNLCNKYEYAIVDNYGHHWFPVGTDKADTEELSFIPDDYRALETMIND